MNYLQSLLALDASAIASFDPDFYSPGTSPAAAKSWYPRLDALLQEASGSATFVAVSASIANALANPRLVSVVSANAFRTFIVPDMPYYAASMNRLIDGEPMSELALPFQTFYARVGLMRRMTQAYAGEAASPSDRTVDLATLQDACANACRAAIALLAALSATRGDQAADHNPSEPCTPQSQLIELLAAAAHCQHPCVEADGCIVIPGWAERRRHTRHCVDFPVEIHAFGQIWVARAFDAASGGLGLEGAGSLKFGDAISVKIPDGRHMQTKVAWVSGTKAGIKFLRALAPGDPMIGRQIEARSINAPLI